MAKASAGVKCTICTRLCCALAVRLFWGWKGTICNYISCQWFLFWACAGAWRHVTMQGQRRALVPALVTGCKIWHMRDAGVFFPKTSFLNTVEAIPEGSAVCFLTPSMVLTWPKHHELQATPLSKHCQSLHCQSQSPAIMQKMTG